jgi:hypothetical protein
VAWGAGAERRRLVSSPRAAAPSEVSRSDAGGVGCAAHLSRAGFHARTRGRALAGDVAGAPALPTGLARPRCAVRCGLPATPNRRNRKPELAAAGERAAVESMVHLQRLAVCAEA